MFDEVKILRREEVGGQHEEEGGVKQDHGRGQGLRRPEIAGNHRVRDHVEGPENQAQQRADGLRSSGLQPAAEAVD